MKLPSRAAVIAVATAMQESRLINRTDRDRDSVRLFQQRPSQGWGTIAQLTTPAYAARAFYNHLVKIPGWQTLPLTRAAQAVQRSAREDAYAQWEPLATALVTGPTVGLNSNGSGKPGWDCSGLTMYAVYQATGGRIKLDHLVASQFRDPHVPPHRLQPAPAR